MRFLIRLILIAIVAVCVAIGGLLLLPGEKIAQIAADQISKQTGRKVEISSDSSISLYPILGITTGRAIIGSTDWAQEGPLLETDSLAIGLDIPTLLTGTIRISKLEANAPRITLEKDAEGRANWEFFETAEIPAQDIVETPLSDEEQASQSYDFSLEKAVIKNATLRYIDRETGTAQSFENVDLTVRWPNSNSAAEISLGASPFGERIDLDAVVGDVAGIANGDATPLSGTVSTGSASATFAGTASIAPTAALQMTLAASNANDLLKAAGLTPEALGLPSTFAPNVSFEGNVTFDGTRAMLRGVDAVIDQNKLSGDADIILQDAPKITAKLRADIAQLGTLMRLAGQKPAAFGFDPAFNPAIATDLTLQMAGTSITANMTDLKAQIEDASAAGTVNFALKSGQPDIAGKLQVNLPKVAKIAKLVGQPLTGFGLSQSASPAFSGTVDLSMKGAALTAKIANLSAALDGAKATGALNFAYDGKTPNVSGKIKATIPSTKKLMASLGQTPADIPRGFGQSISANTNLSFTGSSLKLSDMSVTLDNNAISGNVAVGLSGARPSVSATLAAGALDFSSLTGGTDAAPAPAGSGWSTERIDASALGMIDGNISLSAKSIDLGTIKLGATNVGITIDNSRAVVTINDLRAYQGSFAGQLVANNRNGFSASANLNMASVALKPLLTSLAGIDKVAGNANAKVKVLGVGNSIDALMKSLSGSLSMSVPEGTIAGIDMNGLMRSGNPNASLTKFSGLQASGTIQNGILSSNDLAAVTGRVEVAGDGQINLGGQSIDYTVTPVVKEVGNKERVSIPVRLRGPWSDIKVFPDLERALEMETERELKKLEAEARKRAEEEKEKLRQQAEAEKQKIREQAEAEARKLEERARQKAEEVARKAAEKLKLDQQNTKQLEDAARNALEKELGKGLRGLLGGN